MPTTRCYGGGMGDTSHGNLSMKNGALAPAKTANTYAPRVEARRAKSGDGGDEGSAKVGRKGSAGSAYPL
jgi:hypothetical protein